MALLYNTLIIRIFRHVLWLTNLPSFSFGIKNSISSLICLQSLVSCLILFWTYNIDSCSFSQDQSLLTSIIEDLHPSQCPIEFEFLSVKSRILGVPKYLSSLLEIKNFINLLVELTDYLLTSKQPLPLTMWDKSQQSPHLHIEFDPCQICLLVVWSGSPSTHTWSSWLSGSP